MQKRLLHLDQNFNIFLMEHEGAHPLLNILNANKSISIEIYKNMNEPEEKKKMKPGKKNQCKLSSHCFMEDSLCPFALMQTRANSALKRDKQPSTLGSSLLNN
jgi:hypothetical protein